MKTPLTRPLESVLAAATTGARLLRRSKPTGGVAFAGSYQSWNAAMLDSTGYNAPVILEKTREALLKVIRGEAAFERDSVIFQDQAYPFPVISAMLREAVNSGDKLNVIDFGGSLGSSYFHCQSFLPALKELKWSVIEQAEHVACGRRDFANRELQFYETIEQCLLARPDPNVLLLSGVLPYLEKPYSELTTLLGLGIRSVIIDRTAFLAGDNERLTVERVPASIYKASYPFWFLSQARFCKIASESYRTVATFSPIDAPLLNEGPGYFAGYILERITP